MNWSVILLTYINLFTYGLLDNTRSALLPELMQYFSLNHSQIGLFFTIGSGLGLIVNLFAFWWLKKFSTIVPMRVSLLGSSLCALFLFLAGAHVNTIFFFISFLCIGLSAPLSSICMNILVKGHSLEKNRAKIYAGLHSCYGLASFLAPLVIGIYTDWKYIYLCISLVFLGAFIYSFKFKISQFAMARVAHLKSFPDRYKWALVVGLYIPTEILLASRLTVILQEKYLYSKIASEQYLGYFFLLLFLGRFIFSQFTPHKNLERQLFLSVICALLFFLGAIFIHPIFFCLVGGALSFFYPMFMSRMSFKVGDHFEALSNFCIMATTISMTFFHFTLGEMFQAWGIGVSLYLFPALCLCLICSMARLFKQK